MARSVVQTEGHGERNKEPSAGKEANLVLWKESSQLLRPAG